MVVKNYATLTFAIYFGTDSTNFPPIAQQVQYLSISQRNPSKVLHLYLFFPEIYLIVELILVFRLQFREERADSLLKGVVCMLSSTSIVNWQYIHNKNTLVYIVTTSLKLK